MLDFLLEYRADIYILLVAVGSVWLFNMYAANLACAQYIKNMIDNFLAHQDKNAAAPPEGTRKQRAKSMEKKIRKQAKLARKANRGK